MSKHSRDLLGLERTTLLEKRLRVCSEVDDANGKPEHSVLSRVRDFLPLIDTANRKLSSEIKENGSLKVDIEHLTDGDEAPHIKMDLALGVAELYTPQAVLAAQQAIGGSVQDQPELCSDDTQSDTSDSGEQDAGSDGSDGSDGGEDDSKEHGEQEERENEDKQR